MTPGEQRRRRIRHLQEQRDFHDREAANEERALGARARHQRTGDCLHWAVACLQVAQQRGILADLDVEALRLIEQEATP